LIRNKIIDKKITFAEAARTESDQKKLEEEFLINPKTQDTRFELTKWIQVLQSSFKLER
jgi:peptidyl-prolyl cis-trans isomerase SurA